MAAKIIPFHRPERLNPPKSRKEKIAEKIARMVDGELAQFADHLVTARAMVKLYPELVAAPTVPEYLCAFKSEWDWLDANNPDVNWGTPHLSKREMREIRKLAIRIVDEGEACHG